MGFFGDHPGIGILLLGAAVCIVASGANLFALSVFGEAIEAGPTGPLSGPLWVLGILLIFVGVALETKKAGILS